MKKWIISALMAASVVSASAQAKAKESGNRLLEFLTVDKPVQAEFIEVKPDPGMEVYAKLINAAEKKDPKWFAEHQTKSEAGTPLAWHEKLMSKENYDAYLANWDLRKIAPVKNAQGKKIPVSVMLSKEGDSYYVNVSDVPISTLAYNAKTDTFKSTLGELKFLEVIKAHKLSALRAWQGYEWKSETKGMLVTTKQNFAIGRTASNKYGYLIYRLQQVNTDGVVTADKRYVLRFAPVKKAIKTK